MRLANKVKLISAVAKEIFQTPITRLLI